jgi:hypothetical protein
MKFATLWRPTAVLLALVLVAGEAAAQPTGSRVGRSAQAGNVDDAELAMGHMARCIADRRPELVRRWLALLPGTREELALLRRESPDFSFCLEDRNLSMEGRSLRFQPRAARRPVALAVVEHRLAQAPAEAPLPPDSDPWFVVPMAAMSAQMQVDRGSLAVQDFGHCVALRAWTDTRALFATEANTPAESAAVRRLTPALGPCLTEGVNIRVTHRNLRLILAEPFYHLMTATSPGAAANR